MRLKRRSVQETRRTFAQTAMLALACLAASGTLTPFSPARGALAQEGPAQEGPAQDGLAQEGPGPTADAPDLPAGEQVPASAISDGEGINILTLFMSGGWFMLPILATSLLVATFMVERWLGLRRSRVLPEGLIEELGKLGSTTTGFDPRKAYRICQQYPSAASNVIRSMLLKVGRPHTEVEDAVKETSQREADRLYANVRWLTLAAAVAPLLGLLGTVWGLIRAFHRTTLLLPGQNKAEHLAEGIYVALVTTLAGLLVAIPAAIAAHYFEGRIQNLFHQISEMLFNLMPQVERYEGRVRFSRQMEEQSPADSDLPDDESVTTPG